MRKNQFISFLILLCMAFASNVSAGDGFYQGGVTLYEDKNFTGNSKIVYNSTSWIGADWNDKISSVRVPAGYVFIAYDNSEYGGASIRITGNWTISDGNTSWNDRISSFKIEKVATIPNNTTLNYSPPSGYSKIANENETKYFSQKVDVAYGVNGKFRYKYGVTGNVSFTNQIFGDPAPGLAKAGYYKYSKVVTPPPPPPPSNGVIVYSDAYYQGNSKVYTNDVSWAGDWNDIISSMKVPSGYVVTAYRDAYYQGPSFQIRGNWTVTTSNLSWNDQISSFKITKDAPPPVKNGWNTTWVTYSNPNSNTKLGDFIKRVGKNWEEVSVSGNKYYFTETRRDEWSVYLFDKSRNVYIQLDLYTKRVNYNVGNNPKTYLYKIIQ